MRRTARLLVALLVIVNAVLVGTVPSVLAQAAPSVGTEVPLVDDQGVTHGTIQVKQLDDPFAGTPDSPPAAGSRYVGIIAVFTAADDQQLDANPYYIVVRDTDGYLYTPVYVARDAADPIPDLQSQTLAPGNRISGFVGYVLPSGAKIDDITYTPSTYLALPLVDVDTDPGPAVGQPIPFTAEDGSQGTFTIKVTDPFTDASSTPAEGTRYVGLQVAIENTGTSVFQADPTDLYLRTSSGALVYPSGFSRNDMTIPDLQSQPLSPGDRVSGFIGYPVPAADTVTTVEIWPSGNRRVRLAAVNGGGAAPTAGPAVSTAPATPEPPVASPTPGASAGVSQ
ncbi:MAG: DUF4352 domain-containing protein [Chloroflexota bacterium]